MDRRRFLGQAAGAALGLVPATSLAAMSLPRPRPSDPGVGPLPGDRLPADPLPDRWGVQLYTLRSLMAESVPDTLRLVAELGYGEVEFAGYFDWAPRELRGVLDDLGLRAPSAHVSLEQLAENREAVFEAAVELGHRHLVVPWIGPEMRTESGYESLVETLSTVGGAARPHGLKVVYHNHDFEFRGVELEPTSMPEGQRFIPYPPAALEYLIWSTDPDLVSFQLDLFWAAHAGHDPAMLFLAHPGRFVSVHVKDRSEAGEMVDVGSGELDFGALLIAAEAAGVEHAFVEHDRPSDPRQSVTRAIQHLESLRG